MDDLLADYMTEKELAEALQRTTRSLSSWRRSGKGPAWTKLGPTVLYRRGAVAEWLRRLEVTPPPA